MPFDGALEMARSIFQIRTFAQQELLRFRSASEDELLVRLRRHDSVLDIVQFNIENLAKIALAQRAEDHDFVDSVHEFRRELPLRDVERRVVELAIDLCQIRLILLYA